MKHKKNAIQSQNAQLISSLNDSLKFYYQDAIMNKRDINKDTFVPIIDFETASIAFRDELLIVVMSLASLLSGKSNFSSYEFSLLEEICNRYVGDLIITIETKLSNNKFIVN